MPADTLTAAGGPLTLTAPSITGDGTFTFATFAPMGGAADEFTAVWRSNSAVAASTYTLDGSLVFTQELESGVGYMGPPVAATLTQGGIAVLMNAATGPNRSAVTNDYLVVIGADGRPEADPIALSPANESGFPNLSTDLAGVHAYWIAELPDGEQPHYMQDYTASGAAVAPPTDYAPYADTSLAGYTFRIVDNQAQLLDGSAAVTLPGEPAGHAVYDPITAGLSNGKAAVAWNDSGSVYLSMYDAATHSISGRQQLDWSAYNTDLHLVTLPDGGFAVSWNNHGAYKGELFDGDGVGGGVLSLTGQFGGIDSHGDLYTVGADAGGQAVVQTYAINGASGGGGTGQTFNSDNNGDVWVGTAGNDTFNLGRGGDWVAGNGGDDFFKFAAIPWAGGHITDFNAGDVLDLTGLMSTTSDTGTDGFADGYLKITDDGSGTAQVWANYHIPGNDGWWLVETLDGVAPASLQHVGDTISVGSSSGGGGSPGPTDVTTSDASYTAPPSVKTITLAGSQQTVTANNAQDTTIWSNNTGNAIQGGTGDDTIHIGRGGDWVDGGAGKDLFVFGDIPWAPATIEALYPDQGDSIDVSGILAKAGYTGADPIADGYLKISGNQIFANYNLPGNDGWWQVATVYTPGQLQYAGGGVIDDFGEHLGGTVTVNGQPGGPSIAGADTIIMTGSNLSFGGNDGGDTLIDQGSNNQMYGGKGNDTLVLGTSTAVASDGWGSDDTWVFNPQSTVVTQDVYGVDPGDRFDVRALLSASHYSGSDPVGDGYVFVTNPPAPEPGEMGDFRRARLMYDPDGTAGPAVARALFDSGHALPNQFHYADGFFVVQ